VPLDVAAGLAGRGDGDAVLDGDLVGVGLHGDVCGLARVGQPDLDPLPVNHDGPADRDPSCDGELSGQSGWLSGCGAGSPEPGVGLFGHGAGEGADQDAAGQDVGEGAVHRCWVWHLLLSDRISGVADAAGLTLLPGAAPVPGAGTPGG
jgi:hypothetical protein